MHPSPKKLLISQPVAQRKAEPNKQPAIIARMFDRVAPAYDRTNCLLSLGQVRCWRAATRRALRVGVGDRVLDLGAGTGGSSVAVARTGAEVVAYDISPGMLGQGRRRWAGRFRNITWCCAPAVALGQEETLPFGSASFDAALAVFSLRNMSAPGRCLEELHRVLRPGGRLVICEFSHPQSRVLSQLNRAYQQRVIPVVAGVSSSDPAAYRYLISSINAWPDQRRLARKLCETGFRGVRWRNLAGGAVALHYGINSGINSGIGAGIKQGER